MPDYARNRRGEEGSDSFFCRFTFGQFFALLVLEVCTIFFVFYLGARYGREFLGLDKGKVVAESMQSAEPSSSEATDTRVATTADPEVARMAKDLIEKAQTPELKDRISRMIEDAQGKGPKTPPVVEVNRAAGEAAEEVKARAAVPGKGEELVTGSDIPRTHAEAEAEPRAPREQGPEASTPEERAGKAKSPQDHEVLAAEEKAASSDKSVVRVKSVENARYSLQVGSYPQMGEASRVVDRWKGKGYPAYVMIADIPDRGRWYRVRIGGFGTREDAVRYLKEFQQRENIEGLIVMNEQ